MQAQPYTDTVFGKGGQISESLALWFKSQKKVPNYNPEHRALLFRWIVLRVVIFVTLWGDISAKSEKLSKIKPPFAVLNYNVA